MGRVGRLRVADRRRRGASDRVRTALLDAVARTEGLGLTVVGVYDASIFASTSSWVDARGTTSGGPTITLTGSPTLSNGVYTFNGTTQYGRAEGGRLSEITGGAMLVVIGSLPATDATYLCDLSVAGTSRILGLRRVATSNLNAIVSGNPSASASSGTGRRVLHGRRTAVSGGNVTVAARVGAGTEVANAGAGADGTASRLSICSDLTAAAKGAADVATVVVIAGAPATPATVQAIWTQYGVLRGATA